MEVASSDGGVVAESLHNVHKRLDAAQEGLLVHVLVVIVQQNLNSDVSLIQ